MQKNSKFKKSYISIFIFSIIVFILLAVSFVLFMLITAGNNRKLDQNSDNDRNYHIVVLGTYENQSFLQKIYDGAQNYADYYNAVIELYVPNSKAENLPFHKILDYASYVNADGIIAYIDSADEVIPDLTKIHAEPIPLVTTGHFASGIKQISFIGNNYWELGNTIGTETVAGLNENGIAFIISSEYSSNITYSNMTNSIQTKLKNYPGISYEVVDQVTLENKMNDILEVIKENLRLDKNVIFVCLTEEDTIRTAQLLTEINILSDKHVNLIGFGNNETCQGYLNKGTIKELISLDPNSIGEAAIRELFEYKRNGYANSYIAADVIIQKGINNEIRK